MTSSVPEDAYPTRVAPQPTVTPRLDPVVWSPSDIGGPLSKVQVAHYKENGYLILENVFDEAELSAFKAVADDALGLRAIAPETVVLEPGSKAVRSIFEVHRQVPAYAKLARDPRLAGIARFLLDDEVYIHQSRLNYKPGFDGRDFWWHSDFETWHAEDGMPRMRALSMTIMLTDNLPVNGPLLLIDGSHKHFVACVGETPVNHHEQSLQKQEYGVPDRDSISALSKNGMHPATGKAGSVIVFDCNTLHGSGSNISPYPRSNLFLVYNSMKNCCGAPFCGLPPRPQHVANRENVQPLK